MGSGEGDVVRYVKQSELDPCGECPSGTCDHCDMCDYFADREARGWPKEDDPETAPVDPQ